MPVPPCRASWHRGMFPSRSVTPVLGITAEAETECACRDKHFVATNICRDTFVATSLLLSRQNTYLSTEHNFVATKHKTFVATNTYLSRQKYFLATSIILSRQKFCRSKHTFVTAKDVFVATKMIPAAAPANDIRQLLLTLAVSLSPAVEIKAAG